MLVCVCVTSRACLIASALGDRMKSKFKSEKQNEKRAFLARIGGNIAFTLIRIAGIAISKETFTDAAHEQRNYY